MDNYDAWKTACCGRYPKCNPCPYLVEEEENMKEIWVICKENGDKIEKVDSVREGLLSIEQFEQSDKKEGTYEPDFYDVVEVEE